MVEPHIKCGAEEPNCHQSHQAVCASLVGRSSSECRHQALVRWNSEWMSAMAEKRPPPPPPPGMTLGELVGKVILVEIAKAGLFPEPSLPEVQPKKG